MHERRYRISSIVLDLIDKLIRRREEQLAQVDEEFKSTEPFSVSLSLVTDDPRIPNKLENLIEVATAGARSSDVFFGASTEANVAAARFDGTNIELTTMPGCIPFVSDRFTVRQFGLRSRTSAILVIPHWNADPRTYDGICRALSLFGFRTLCLTLPYHGERGISGSRLANLFVSANLGQTIQSIRRSVAEVRQITAWLHENGFKFIGLIGVSLGSCIASLVAAHDTRIDAAVLALTAGDFAEVVWTGRATRHIRAALDGKISLEDLRAAWHIISPQTYVERLAVRSIPVMMIAGKRDEVILPTITARYADALKASHARLWTLALACGHYTLSSLPFNLIALLATASFLAKHRRSKFGGAANRVVVV